MGNKPVVEEPIPTAVDGTASQLLLQILQNEVSSRLAGLPQRVVQLLEQVYLRENWWQDRPHNRSMVPHTLYSHKEIGIIHRGDHRDGKIHLIAFYDPLGQLIAILSSSESKYHKLVDVEPPQFYDNCKLSTMSHMQMIDGVQQYSEPVETGTFDSSDGVRSCRNHLITMSYRKPQGYIVKVYTPDLTFLAESSVLSPTNEGIQLLKPWYNSTTDMITIPVVVNDVIHIYVYRANKVTLHTTYLIPFTDKRGHILDYEIYNDVYLVLLVNYEEVKRTLALLYPLVSNKFTKCQVVYCAQNKRNANLHIDDYGLLTIITDNQFHYHRQWWYKGPIVTFKSVERVPVPTATQSLVKRLAISYQSYFATLPRDIWATVLDRYLCDFHREPLSHHRRFFPASLLSYTNGSKRLKVYDGDGKKIYRLPLLSNLPKDRQEGRYIINQNSPPRFVYQQSKSSYYHIHHIDDQKSYGTLDETVALLRNIDVYHTQTEQEPYPLVVRYCQEYKVMFTAMNGVLQIIAFAGSIMSATSRHHELIRPVLLQPWYDTCLYVPVFNDNHIKIYQHPPVNNGELKIVKCYLPPEFPYNASNIRHELYRDVYLFTLVTYDDHYEVGYIRTVAGQFTDERIIYRQDITDRRHSVYNIHMADDGHLYLMTELTMFHYLHK